MSEQALFVFGLYMSTSISIEVQNISQLTDAGFYAVYCYKETYNKSRYKVYHTKGLKSKFDW
ncbi:hypothetical protein [Dysgonomonas sp. BGC7]|uniref:hypothetical protein n=1 Tax=Dysgonomonas sp. BGC7 TaxID=1658008 RepID=UPI0006832653|nr:hypothetical protein [Dysgonomonas sp. BGC7]